MPTDFAASYLAYLGGQFRTEATGSKWTRIITPFLDRHNDCMVIDVWTGDDGRLRLTDSADTLDDRAMSGRDVDWAALRVTLAGFGVEEKRGELCVECEPAQFGEAFHRLLQAMWAAAWS